MGPWSFQYLTTTKAATLGDLSCLQIGDVIDITAQREANKMRERASTAMMMLRRAHRPWWQAQQTPGARIPVVKAQLKIKKPKKLKSSVTPKEGEGKRKMAGKLRKGLLPKKTTVTISELLKKLPKKPVAAVEKPAASESDEAGELLKELKDSDFKHARRKRTQKMCWHAERGSVEKVYRAKSARTPHKTICRE